MQRMYRNIYDIVISINQFYGFLLFTLYINFLQTAKLSNSVVNMRYIIANRKRCKFFQCNGLLVGVAVFYTEFMESFKNLMIGITSNRILFFDKTLKQWHYNDSIL